jgi:hypothetical protein
LAISQEVSYLQRYYECKKYLHDNFEMPDNMVANVVLFLERNDGVLSKRTLAKEFSNL